MPRIITTCPNTGETVPTGYRSTDFDLDKLVAPMSFRCSVCQKIHVWSAQEASVEDVARFAA